MRLYLCDDNPSHRVLYREALADAADLELIGAGGDPRRVVDELHALRPDIVLLDVGMPGVDGFAALPRFREVLPDAVIIMFSTAWSVDNEERALALGATAYVQKPRDITDLPRLIRGAAGDATALVEHLVERWLAGDVDRAVAALRHDVELLPLTEGPVHGIEEVRRAAHRRPAGIRAAIVRPVGLLERAGKVVLFATAEVTRAGPDGDSVEKLNPAWVMTARHGKLARIKAHPSWDDARTAAGIGSGAGAPKLRRLGQVGRLVLAAARRRAAGEAPRRPAQPAAV